MYIYWNIVRETISIASNITDWILQSMLKYNLWHGTPFSTYFIVWHWQVMTCRSFEYCTVPLSCQSYSKIISLSWLVYFLLVYFQISTMVCSGPTTRRIEGRERLQHGFFSPEFYRGLSILLYLRSTRTLGRHLRSTHHHHTILSSLRN